MPELDEWVIAVAAEFGLPDDVDVALLLDVAREVAHGVQRPAAPVTTYLMGLAVARGATPEEAAATIRRALEDAGP